MPEPVEHSPYVPCRMCGDDGLHWTGTSGAYALYECAVCGFVFAPAVRRLQAEAANHNGQHAVANGALKNGWDDGLRFLAPAFERLMGNGPDGSGPGGSDVGGSGPFRILGFGCGQSRVPELLRERGHRVVGVDLLPPRPEERPHEDRLTGDLLRLRLEPEQFDLAYSSQVFEHLPEPRPVLDELLRLVRPGGLVLVHTDMETEERLAAERNGGFAEWGYVMPPAHCSYYRPCTFEQALEGRDAHVEWSGPKSVLIRVGGPPSP